MKKMKNYFIHNEHTVILPPECTVMDPLQPSLEDDMMERAEWRPDVRLYIGPDKGTGRDGRQRRCISHAPYHVHHIP